MTIREEAEKYAESNDGGSDPRYNGLEEGYLAAFDGETVRALVEALKVIAEMPDGLHDQIDVMDKIEMRGIAREALQKFQEARNG